jgi:hypothetical protein
MFERFTERARRVVVLAQQEARMLDHDYIGTEHILLGLIREADGIAARVIESAGLTLGAARAEVEALIGRGGSAPPGHIPFTPRAKKVLELALREALTQNKSYIGPEHILLGLTREGDGVGAQILARLAFPLPVLRAEVIKLAAAEPTDPLAADWASPGPQVFDPGPRVARRGIIGVQAQVVIEFRETLASLGRTLAALDQRLAAIESRLGIAAAAEEPADPEAPAESEEFADPEESAGPGESVE